MDIIYNAEMLNIIIVKTKYKKWCEKHGELR